MALSLNVGTIVQHEMAHKQIFEHYHIKSYIHVATFNQMLKGYFAYTQPILEQNQTMPEQAVIQNNLNEIVGYNVQSIVGTMISLFFLFFMFKEVDKDDYYKANTLRQM